jgi:hypothetical protein
VVYAVSSSYHIESNDEVINKQEFWEEIIRILSLHKLTTNNLVAMFTMEHKQSKPTPEEGSPTTLNLNIFNMIKAMGLNIIELRSP